MKLTILLNDSNCVVGYSEESNSGFGIEMEVPDTFKDELFIKYKVLDGKLIEMSDEEFATLYPNYYKAEDINRQEKLFSNMQRMATLQSLPNEQAISLTLLYPEWINQSESYTKDYLVTYESKLYRCLQAHTSQADWMPKSAPSLWVEIADPKEEWPLFKQPTGAQDCYRIGDKVTFEDEHYMSNIDNNVWSPKDYPQGWTKK